MINMIGDSYKMFLRNSRWIVLYSLPILILSSLYVYFQSKLSLTTGIVYVSYFVMLLLPLVSAATDVSIYRRLFHFSQINPLSSLRAFVLYLVVQIVIGLIGTLPIFLFQYLFAFMGFSALLSIVAAIIINIFLGFWLMARFNILLPLIIQNKVPSLPDFMAYTKRPYIHWLEVAALVYMPYTILYYLTFFCPYTNNILTTLFMFVFICFNVAFVNANRMMRPIVVSAVKTQPESSVVVKVPKAEPRKAPLKKKAPKAKAPTAPHKPTVSKPAPKKASGKKKPAPKLKPITA